MTKPLTKEQRAEMLRNMFETPHSYVHVIKQLEDSHALADEALNLATAKLATAKVCEECGGKGKRLINNCVAGTVATYEVKCPHCTNGVQFSDERARELLERLARAEEDSARLQWYLSDKPKAFLDTYMQGVREQWDIERWRREIDSARAKEAK